MSSIGLLHCSDLHIGREPGNDQFTQKPVLRYANAHALPLARGLTEVVDDVAQQCGLGADEPPRVIMSGDLTATGHAKEFVVAHTYLRSFWRIVRDPQTRLAGLDVRDSTQDPNPRLAAVAGNHEQWRGRGFMHNVGYTPALRNTHFRATSWIRTWRSGNLELEVYGLDSNAGLPQAKGSWRQRGELDLSPGGEIANLERDLKQNSSAILPPGVQYRVRAFLLHHSLASGGGVKKASVQKLLELAETHSFAAVLTGHTHDFIANPRDTLPTRHHKLWELRSASALQGPENRQNPSAGFLAHRLWVDGNQVRWQAWRYLWDVAAQAFAIWQPDVAAPFADFVAP
jgi:3',5'-cyclic AMP phosphodiesterase CpdA